MAEKFRYFLLAALTFAALLGSGLSAAWAADDFGTLVQNLGAKSYGGKIKAVNALAATGDPRAADILRAMVERDLYIRNSDKRIVIARKEGAQYVVIDPLTGENAGAAAKSDLKKLRSNNRLRRTIRTVLGVLTLASADPARRIAAAESIFKTPKPDQIGLLTKALAREQDQSVREALTRALAAAELVHGKNPEIRIAAVSRISTSTDPGVTGLLKKIIAGPSP
ncbi:MAG: urea ABC transporter permease subunit UrtB, partial [Alphaproteobacteria bacterium]